ncbi:MAG: DUF4271 domain-containing protein [Bacteroidales bacterium]|nr:DUF4271 domain-containing protein [Bacteroidales bacterium]
MKISTDSVNVPADTILQGEVSASETVGADSLTSTEIIRSAPVKREDVQKEVDTVSVCFRSSVADITFTQPDRIIPELYAGVDRFPVLFVQKNSEILSAKRQHIEKSLREGEAMPATPFRNDWTIGVIIFSVILFSLACTSVKTLSQSIARFFLFRGTRDVGEGTAELFQWKSMLLNVSSFLIIAIFASFAISYGNIMPGSLTGFKTWIFSAGVISAAFALRHIVCATVGQVSGAAGVFNDYIITAYQSYRFAGFFLFILIVLFYYTPFVAAKNCFTAGCTIIAFLYLMRVLRLFLLFINHKISIFYLILYLCALEILPVLVLMRYCSGLRLT